MLMNFKAKYPVKLHLQQVHTCSSLNLYQFTLNLYVHTEIFAEIPDPNPLPFVLLEFK